MSVLLPALVSVALAESAGLLQEDAAVVYAGAGATTYAWLNTGDIGGTAPEREVSRAVQTRVDLYGGWQPFERVAFYAYVPLVYSTVAGEPRTPCAEGAVGNCAPFVGVGAAAVQGRVAVLRSPLLLTAGLAVASGAWNAEVRRRYTMVGEASTDVLPSVYLGWAGQVGPARLKWTAWGTYALRIPTWDEATLAEKAPADDVRAGMEVACARGPVELTLGAGTIQRLGGSDFYAYPDSDDVWDSVDYDAFSGSAKVSLSVARDTGVHVGLSRTVWVHNGPVDATDLTVGLHRYFPPK